MATLSWLDLICSGWIDYFIGGGNILTFGFSIVACVYSMYGILNEKQVGIGESTCASKLFAAPVGPSGGGKGKALFDISELSQIALERTSSAREAIQVRESLWYSWNHLYCFSACTYVLAKEFPQLFMEI